MPRFTILLLVLLASPIAASVSVAAQSGPVDTVGVGELIARGIGRSEVMAHLQHLTDVIGPRLSGTPAMRRANDWTAQRLRGYGLTATLEPYPFGVTWERGSASVRLLEPFQRGITGVSWAWTAGTGGRAVSGPVVLADLSTRDSFAVYRGRVKGAWVLPKPSLEIWNPDGPAPTAADSARLAAEQALRSSLTADTSASAVESRRQWQIDLPYLLRETGALGTLTDGNKEHALLTMSGSPNRISPLPNIVISHEDYAHLERLIASGITPKVEARVDNRLGDKPVQQWNTVGEIRGSELPGQVVILGAHLDSWDLGTGATDNAAGSSVVIEAARLIATSGVRPKRTMRFVLFSGEEEGLLGSRAYAAAHAAEADSIQAVLVVDNGTGAIVGQALQGRADLRETWKALLAPVASLGAVNVREAVKTGTDHLPFVTYGVPAFNFDQLPRGYGHTHHSQSDTFDKAVEEDLRQASTVMAVTGWQLANLPTLLPRGSKKPPERIPNRPSSAVAGGK